jgi:cell division protein FtsQ
MVALGQRLAALLGLGVMLFALFVLLDSSTFVVRRVVIQGHELLDREMVADIAGVLGQNIFTLNTRAAAHRVATLPQVKGVRVIARVPNTVVVQVREREVAYTWRSGDRSYLVSSDGTVVGEGEARQGLPSILDKGSRALQLGDRLGGEVLRAADRLTRWLPERTGLSIERFEYSPSEGLSLCSDKGYRVIFGSEENLGAKMVTLQSILEQLAREGRSVQYIDLRVDSRPYVR